MQADVEGFNVIRAIGLRFLFQVICFAGIYKMVNIALLAKSLDMNESE